MATLFQPSTLLFLIPVMTLAGIAAMQWWSCRTAWRTGYDLWARSSLAIPTATLIEIIRTAQWCHAQIGHHVREAAAGKMALLFCLLIPLTAYQVWRFKKCRAFVLFAHLAQLWVALLVTMVALGSMLVP